MTIIFILLTIQLIFQGLAESKCAGYDCLKEYVDKPDSNFAWTDTGIRLQGIDPIHLRLWNGYVLNFTSQAWLTPEDSTRHLWWHILVVIVPPEVDHLNTPFLWITDGDNGNDAIPDALNYNLLIAADIALQTKTIGAALFQIPNQSIRFAEDPLNKARSEDGIIGFTWWKWVNDPSTDPEWLVHLPMTKASVRAMDVITDFLTSPSSPQEIQDLQSTPSQFIVAGASKRAWVTWTTAAVDPRIIAIVPVVMDNLNSKENLHHHYRAYGGWSFAFEDYFEMNITNKLDDPRFDSLMEIIDPFSYRDKILMPKLVIDGTMDEFFLLDDSSYWWNQMPNAYELNRFLMVPNAEHTQITGILELLPAVITWAREILSINDKLDPSSYPHRTIEERNSRSLKLMDISNVPRFNWTVDETNGDITVNAESPPKAVHLWHANTFWNNRRDFRIASLDKPCLTGPVVSIANWDNLCSNLYVIWTAEELTETSPGSLTWIGHRDPPSLGRWTAFFVDLQYDSNPDSNSNNPGKSTEKSKGWPVGEEDVYVFTTEVSIVPRTFPFPECYAEECFGKLV